MRANITDFTALFKIDVQSSDQKPFNRGLSSPAAQLALEFAASV